LLPNGKFDIDAREELTLDVAATELDREQTTDLPTLLYQN